MRDTIRDCERTAFVGGLAAGLAQALQGVDVDAAPAAVAALPSSEIRPGTPVLRHDMATRVGISFVHTDSHRGVPTSVLTAVAARLGAVRLGVTRRLTGHVVQHLSGRIVGGEPTIRKQLVQGTLADALVTTEATRRCLLLTGRSAAAVTDVHDRLTALDWELAKLLGASGYVGDGPACAAHVSRLVANCWVPRERAE